MSTNPANQPVISLLDFLRDNNLTVPTYGPSKVSRLRKEGRLEEAYTKGRERLVAEPENVWAKRDMGWVLYTCAKQAGAALDLEKLRHYLEELVSLNLAEDEKMLFDQLAWVIGKALFATAKEDGLHKPAYLALFELAKSFFYTKPSEAYSFLFKALHKAFKDQPEYIGLCDWWGFDHFRAEDYVKDKLPNGREVISTVEQAHNAYAKALLAQGNARDRAALERFIERLEKLIDDYPSYQYPPYYKAKLLLEMGGDANALAALLPFARKKRTEFWVWDVLADAFSGDKERQVACYCQALSCHASDDFLIKIRQKLASWLVDQQMYSEAKTEIERIMKVRTQNSWNVPGDVLSWTKAGWYSTARDLVTNRAFYEKHLSLADAILFSDVPEEYVVVDFVNPEKKIANFIATDRKLGFFKYDRLLKSVHPGDVLAVRFASQIDQGNFYRAYSASVCNEVPAEVSRLVRDVQGELKVPSGKPFGFVEDVFVHHSLVQKHRVGNGQHVRLKAVVSYNEQKKEWGWKAVKVDSFE